MLVKRILLFWRPDGPNGWMSNWSAHPITENGVIFHTVEHYFMYHKAITMGDYKMSAKILDAASAYEAKRLGRIVDNWDEDKWVKSREEIICTALRLKVDTHPALKFELKLTTDSILGKASQSDTIWGIGFAGADPRSKLPDKWRGENLLGKAWMKVRDSLEN